MTGPIRIIDEYGVYPNKLDRAIIEQRLYRDGRIIPDIRGMIFVFGSNEGGYHGAGAAKYARENRHAEMGVSFGPTGSCFAIPTKDASIKHTLSLKTINEYVRGFISYAQQNPRVVFQVTQIGCGLAGLKAKDIAPMFFFAPKNCLFDTDWEPYLSERAKFWGHQ